jgi:hypothetical protein
MGVVEVARITGGYVSLAKLKLYQIEERPGDDGGVQSLDYGRAFVTRLRGCSPNPFGRATAIYYQLGSAGSVALTLHDVTGRSVRRLAGGPQLAGFHSVAWDGRDDKGRVLPAGVYFCRLEPGATTQSKRVTLIR